MTTLNFEHFRCYNLQAFFGVYDGHGGRKAADFVSERLHENIIAMMNCGFSSSKEEAAKAGYLKTDEEFLKQVIHSPSFPARNPPPTQPHPLPPKHRPHRPPQQSKEDSFYVSLMRSLWICIGCRLMSMMACWELLNKTCCKFYNARDLVLVYI